MANPVNPIGGPRQKLVRVVTASGYSTGDANKLAREAFGAPPAKSKMPDPRAKLKALLRKVGVNIK